MALIAYTTFIPDISPHVAGCPNPVMEFYIRKVCIDLCERAKVWRTLLGDLPVSAGVTSYSLTSPILGSEVSAVLHAKMYKDLALTTSEVPIITMDQLYDKWPAWPDTSVPSAPAAISRMASDAIVLAPVPDALDTYTLRLWAAIRPTGASTEFDSGLFAEYRRAIYHGTLHELFVMPKRPWSDQSLATYHGKQWEYFLYSAKARANKSFSSADTTVQQKPWA